MKIAFYAGAASLFGYIQSCPENISEAESNRLFDNLTDNFLEYALGVGESQSELQATLQQKAH